MDAVEDVLVAAAEPEDEELELEIICPILKSELKLLPEPLPEEDAVDGLLLPVVAVEEPLVDDPIV